MAVMIEGMEMPTGCISCDFCNPFVEEPYCRRLMKRVPKATRLDNCPFIEVPEPHGRLIDADALEELVIKQKYACAGASAHGAITELHKSWGLHDAELMIEAAPTVIPASEEK